MRGVRGWRGRLVQRGGCGLHCTAVPAVPRRLGRGPRLAAGSWIPWLPSPSTTVPRGTLLAIPLLSMLPYLYSPAPQAFKAVAGEGTAAGSQSVGWVWADCSSSASFFATWPSSRSGGAAAATPATRSRRTLLDSPEETIREGHGQAGEFTDWTTDCLGGRRRCPSLFLASWGFQCSNGDGTSCCMKANGKFCTPLHHWDREPAPASWVGRDLAQESSAEPQQEEQDEEDGEVQANGSGSGWASGSAKGWNTATATH